MLLVLMAALVSAQTAADEEIIGYEYRCLPNDVGRPNQHITGHLMVDETGTQQSFYASYRPLEEQNRAFFGVRPANMSKDKSAVGWQLTWREHNPSYPPQKFDLTFENAELQLDFYSRRTLPQNVVMLVGDGKSIGASWGKPLHAFAERWPGRKTGAPFSFQLRNILGVAGGSVTVNWAVYSAPLTANMSYKNLRGEGSIDLQSVRAVREEFEKLRSDLLAKATDYKNQCRKEPVYYNPDAEI
jgi:hypothetical protein